MLLYGWEMDTPLNLITNSDGLGEPGIPYPESLTSTIQDAHDHARAVLDSSHAKTENYYDRKRRSVSYCVNDLVRE